MTGTGANEWFRGIGGADIINGAGGTDTVSYLGSSGVMAGLDGTVGSGGEAQGDVLTNVETLQGTQFDYTLWGGAGGNSLFGDADNDSAALASGTGPVTAAQLSGVLSRTETIGFSASGTNANQTVDTSFIQGISGAGNASKLTLDFNAGDSLQIASGTFFTQTGNDYTF